MTIPDYETLMLPLLKIAAEAETRIPDIADRVATEFGLSPEERAKLLPSGRQLVLHNRLHWAKFYMTKAGLIDVPRRGRFVASAQGRELLARNPSQVNNALLRTYPTFVEFLAGSSGEPVSPETSHEPSAPQSTQAAVTPEEQVEAAFGAMQTALRAELLDRILQNSPSFFEEVIVNLLVAMGYGGSHRNAAHQLGRSGDGGVDGIINEDRLGLDRVYVQAKRYAPGNTVGRPDIQAFVGSLVGLGANKGVFVTTSTFSAQAVEFAKHLSQRVILINGQHLADLMIEHGVGVRTARTVEFKRIDEDFFSEEE